MCEDFDSPSTDLNETCNGKITNTRAQYNKSKSKNGMKSKTDKTTLSEQFIYPTDKS
jgi:hypothetical protein